MAPVALPGVQATMDHNAHTPGPDGEELVTSVDVICPHCGKRVEHLLDPGGGAHQEYVEDCEVCCRPWFVILNWDGSAASVQVEPLED